jgi:ABC-type lipoprotein release transport system permease subunit
VWIGAVHTTLDRLAQKGAALLFVVAAGAPLWPARRAARIDPLQALRDL